MVSLIVVDELPKGVAPRYYMDHGDGQVIAQLFKLNGEALTSIAKTIRKLEKDKKQDWCVAIPVRDTNRKVKGKTTQEIGMVAIPYGKCG